MPNQVLDRGHVANLGAGVVPGNLQCIGVGATYTIQIGANAPVGAAIPPGQVNTYAVNGQAVHVTNTTGGAGPPNMTISW